VPLSPHSRDPDAIVFRTARLAFDAGDVGAWAGKIGSHAAHHRFGSLGRLPHVQLNLWRVGVKGSGRSIRVPLVSLGGALTHVTRLLQ
jgi:hypothetical protein